MRILLIMIALVGLTYGCQPAVMSIKYEDGERLSNRYNEEYEYKDGIEYYSIVYDSLTGDELARFPQKEGERSFWHKLDRELMLENKAFGKKLDNSFYLNCEICIFYDSIMKSERFDQLANLKSVNYVFKYKGYDLNDAVQYILERDIDTKHNVIYISEPKLAESSNHLLQQLNQYYSNGNLDTLNMLKSKVLDFTAPLTSLSYRVTFEGKEFLFSFPAYCSFLATKNTLEYISKNLSNPMKVFYISGKTEPSSYENYYEMRTVISEYWFYHDDDGDLQVRLKTLNPICRGNHGYGEIGAVYIPGK